MNVYGSLPYKPFYVLASPVPNDDLNSFETPYNSSSYDFSELEEGFSNWDSHLQSQPAYELFPMQEAANYQASSSDNVFKAPKPSENPDRMTALILRCDEIQRQATSAIDQLLIESEFFYADQLSRRLIHFQNDIHCNLNNYRQLTIHITKFSSDFKKIRDDSINKKLALDKQCSELFSRYINTPPSEIFSFLQEYLKRHVYSIEVKDILKKSQGIKNIGTNTFKGTLKKRTITKRAGVIGWGPKNKDVHSAMFSMFKNTMKAILESTHDTHLIKSILVAAKPQEAVEHLQSPQANLKVLESCRIKESSDIGNVRDEMQDVTFSIETSKSIFAGVLDGHGKNGKTVAELLKEFFVTKFPIYLKKYKGNVHQAFEEIFVSAQQHLNSYHNEISLKSGTTAVLCYIDKATGLIYTATVGDSNMSLYRKINGKMKAIPLSRLKTWGTESEEKRLFRHFQNKYPQHFLELYTQPSKCRRPNMVLVNEQVKLVGPNVPRTLGDTLHSGTKDFPAVISKPNILIQRLMKGDIVIGCSDGVNNYVSNQKIIELIEGSDFESLSQEIIDYTLFATNSTDNLSVITIKV